MQFEHIWSCDIDERVREFVKLNFPVKNIFPDVTQPRSLPASNVYVAGFPCTPWSLQHNGSREWSDPAARAAHAVFNTAQEQQAPVVVFENVEGLKSRKGSWAKLRRLFKQRLPNYRVLVLHLNPLHFHHPMSRPRLYFVCLRADVARTSEASVFERVVVDMLSAATHHFQKWAVRSWEAWLLPQTSGAGNIAASRSTRQSRKWVAQSKQIRAELRVMSLPQVTGLTAREQDVFEIAVARHPAAKLIAVDVSQSAHRTPTQTSGTLPALLPAGKVVVCSKSSRVCRRLTGLEMCHAMGVPIHSMRIPVNATDKDVRAWAGRSMELKSVATALLIGITLSKMSSSKPCRSMPMRGAQIIEFKYQGGCWRCLAPRKRACKPAQRSARSSKGGRQTIRFRQQQKLLNSQTGVSLKRRLSDLFAS